jgi:hypothetical protein
MPAPSHAPVDYDLHGLAGVRLLDAAAGDVAAVDRQLGPIRGALRREPDIVVRFVDELEVRGPVRLLGLAEAGFSDDAFLLLRSRHKARARVQLPLDEAGGDRCEIVCERGLPAVPLLIAVLNLTVLSRGALPLHASSVIHDGTGLVATGWSKGGKTEAVLAFTANGARFVGDEWIYVEPDGRTVHGIPEPLRLWDWQLRQLPAVRAQVGRGHRMRLGTLRTVEGAGRLAARRGGRVRRPAERVSAFVSRQLHADVAPERLLAPGAIALSGPFDRLFLVGSWERPDTVVREIDPAEVADRMAASLEHERAPLTEAYERFRFAFPDRRNPHIDEAPERERALLRRVFAGKTAYAVEHPYPVDLEELFGAMSSVL